MKKLKNNQLMFFIKADKKLTKFTIIIKKILDVVVLGYCIV